jgi:hypothetical protein
LLFAVSNIFAGGISEYKGKKYLTGEFAGMVAYYHVKNHDLSQFLSQEQIKMGADNNRLYFVGITSPQNTEALAKRGYIQQGDIFIVSDDGSHARYNGSPKNITDPAWFKNEGPFWGIGYSVRG